MIRFGREICGDPEAASSREWLETNGLGGFASSTVIGLNTRRYHGLLIAAIHPPVGRFLLLSKLEETLVADGQRFELSANRYPGVIQPLGYQFLREFRLDPFPVFTWEVGGVEVEKSVFLVQGENTVVVQYRVPEHCTLEVRPLIAFRDYHATTHENGTLDSRVQQEPGMATIAPYGGLPPLHMAHNAGKFDVTQYWFRRFQYNRERERGLDFEEDLFSPFVLTFSGPDAAVIASTEPRSAGAAEELREREISRRRPLTGLAGAAEQFIVARGERKTVIAGYPWFGDWGRDTMISLPGLVLFRGRDDRARSILENFAQYVDRGMLPNRFPEAGETPEYNTVDATLWFFEAVRALLAFSQDYDFVRSNLYATLKEIIDWHVRGTRFGIHVDSDGLLAAGEPGVQLTWMDAKVGHWVVTPRSGKAVEIQALWYNALRIMEELDERFGGTEPYGGMAAQARESFTPLFWSQSAGCLYDVVDGEKCDASIRPNQIFTISLEHAILSDSGKAARVVDVVERELLTPYGLRSLAPGDPNYRGRYEGDQRSRDAAYHQGTVWPWLLGPFIRAYVKVKGADRGKISGWLEPLRAHLTEAGLGQISEIFDGDAPHHPRGCIAQAWSVAELLPLLYS